MRTTTPAPGPFRFPSPTRRSIRILGALLPLFFILLALTVRAETTATGSEDFGQYLADHQADLTPFFQKYSSDFVGHGMPVVLTWIGRMMLATLIVGWVLDVVLSRGFSGLFAPALARIPRALVYATGHLVLSIVLTVLFSLTIVFISGLSYLSVLVITAVAVFAILATVIQIAWIRYLYRTDVFISLLFFITLAVIHGFIALGISAPLVGAPANDEAKAFIDGTISPKLEQEAADLKKNSAATDPAAQKAAAEAATLRDQISAGTEEIAKLKDQIEQEKQSAGYLYSQLVKVHARGDLAAAAQGFTDFLTRFPGNSFTGLAKGQLVQVQNEIAAQAAQKKQADADAARAAAAARADLLARAAKGQVSLSEMRGALIGKTRADVQALFGPPTETASDRWGYGQKMILNPLTSATSGLAIYFNEGIVQGVDYYNAPGGGP